MTDDMDWLTDWVERAREADPEAEVVLRIENVDNPGWMVSLDAVDVGFDPGGYAARIENSSDPEGPWLRVMPEGRYLRSVCGPKGSGPALRAMRQAIELHMEGKRHA